jgi:hypothetical protein
LQRLFYGSKTAPNLSPSLRESLSPLETPGYAPLPTRGHGEETSQVPNDVWRKSARWKRRAPRRVFIHQRAAQEKKKNFLIVDKKIVSWLTVFWLTVARWMSMMSAVWQ